MANLRAEIRLDRVVYAAVAQATATVTLRPGATLPLDPEIAFAGSQLNDVERVRLRATD